jgi:hypothetical protein
MMEGGCAAIKQTLEQTASDQTRLPVRGSAPRPETDH